jgi:hypothetical protein
MLARRAEGVKNDERLAAPTCAGYDPGMEIRMDMWTIREYQIGEAMRGWRPKRQRGLDTVAISPYCVKSVAWSIDLPCSW